MASSEQSQVWASSNLNPNPNFQGINNNSKPTTPTERPLSSQAATGHGSTKVSKRRSRAAMKPPIRILSADKSNFRDMVQKLTGIPASSPAFNIHGMLRSASATSPWAAAPVAGGAPVFKPMPPRSSSFSNLDNSAPPALPTLDTSSAYLHHHNLMHHDISGELAFLQSLAQANYNMQSASAASAAADRNVSVLDHIASGAAASASIGQSPSPFSNSDISQHSNLPLYNNPDQSFDTSSIDLKSILSSSNYGDLQPLSQYQSSDFNNSNHNIHILKQAAELESLLMDNDNSNNNNIGSGIGIDKFHEFAPSINMPHSLNSWFSNDGIHTPTPKMQIA